MPGPSVSQEEFFEILLPYDSELTDALVEKLAVYLDLLLRWNARTNLTAIRDPAEIVRRHFGESLFMARHLPACATLLDLGSGAGFPGLPIQLALPHLSVTLGESQNKKASFLREAVRTLCLSTEVWAGRVEDMPSERLFDVVAMRAVDDPGRALVVGRQRLGQAGRLALLTTDTSVGGLGGAVYPLPGSGRMVMQLCP